MTSTVRLEDQLSRAWKFVGRKSFGEALGLGILRLVELTIPHFVGKFDAGHQRRVECVADHRCHLQDVVVICQVWHVKPRFTPRVIGKLDLILHRHAVGRAL